MMYRKIKKSSFPDKQRQQILAGYMVNDARKQKKELSEEFKRVPYGLVVKKS